MNQTCTFDVDVTGQDVESYAQLTGDRNPLHTSADYARTTEFGRPIVHGGFLVGLVSRVLGMHIPGERSLILSLSVRFPRPLFYPGRVRVTGRLTQFNAERGTGAVRVEISDLAKGWAVLESDVLFGLHAPAAEAASPSIPAPPAAVAGNRRRLLVTGATGGIGRALLPELAAYELITVSRRSTPSVDLEEPGAFERFLDECDPAGFYGVVHLSVPAVSSAFASDDIAGVRQQLRHAVEVPLLLAHWARRERSAVKRLVMVGSTFGSIRPRPQVGAYSLGKAAMEHLARLLTADLAAQGATVNVVAPGVVPVGLNEGLSARAQKTLVGRVPTARLVEPADIAAVVTFLLSDAASQVNGATIGVHGGAEE
jgi:NAD(P)-dependent dehydrogenase (short-subunit alcohol dehydrogenase family)/acyl dehydratase